MGIEQRLSKAERLVGKRGACVCRSNIRTYYARAVFPWQSNVRPPDACEVCGGIVMILQIVYVEDWRSVSHGAH